MTRIRIAEIAQVVEHNLAKVGVAGPSPVFRSIYWTTRRNGFLDDLWLFNIIFAQVAELVDAHVSGACAARRAGSSPVLGTICKNPLLGGDMLERWRNW